MASYYENLCSSESASNVAFQIDLLRFFYNDFAFFILKGNLIRLVKGEIASPITNRLFQTVVGLCPIIGRFLDSHGHVDLINILRGCGKLKKLCERVPWLSVALEAFDPDFGLVDYDLPSGSDTMVGYDFAKWLIESDLDAYQRFKNGGQRVLSLHDAVTIFFFGPIAPSLGRDMFEHALKSYEEVPGADFEVSTSLVTFCFWEMSTIGQKSHFSKPYD